MNERCKDCGATENLAPFFLDPAHNVCRDRQACLARELAAVDAVHRGLKAFEAASGLRVMYAAGGLDFIPSAALAPVLGEAA